MKVTLSRGDNFNDDSADVDVHYFPPKSAKQLIVNSCRQTTGIHLTSPNLFGRGIILEGFGCCHLENQLIPLIPHSWSSPLTRCMCSGDDDKDFIQKRINSVQQCTTEILPKQR